jgi:Nucleotide modification associated domain 2
MRYYVYKMTADNGGAPHVAKGMLSLAICKPMIRRTAKDGDVIFGFGGKRLGERLIYVAQINKKCYGNEYYKEGSGHNGRDDCIYTTDENGAAQPRPRRKYHSESFNLNHDVGKFFEHGEVLLSEQFRYFGKEPINISWPHEFPSVYEMVHALQRGHRVNHDPDRLKQLEDLKNEVFARCAPSERVESSDSDCSLRCSDCESGIAIDETSTLDIAEASK